jgi:hypothetical protein
VTDPGDLVAQHLGSGADWHPAIKVLTTSRGRRHDGEIPWVYVEAAIGIAVCVAAGAVLGVVGTLLRIVVERRG